MRILCAATEEKFPLLSRLLSDNPALWAAEKPRNDFLSKVVMTVGREKSGIRRRLRIYVVHSFDGLGNAIFIFGGNVPSSCKAEGDGWKMCLLAVHVTQWHESPSFCQSSSFCDTIMFAIKLAREPILGDDYFSVWEDLADMGVWTVSTFVQRAHFLQWNQDLVWRGERGMPWPGLGRL